MHLRLKDSSFAKFWICIAGPQCAVRVHSWAEDRTSSQFEGNAPRTAADVYTQPDKTARFLLTLVANCMPSQ